MSKRPLSKEGSVFGGILLIAGSCIGAGMLGLPVQTGLSGFFPSLAAFFVACLFMTTTALLLVEITSRFPLRANLLSISEKILGPFGKHLCWITYLFLFYSLLVAYISGSGGLFQTILMTTFSKAIPIWICSLIFVLLFGWVVYLGTREVDLLNRFFMVGKIGFFVLFLCVSVSFIQPKLLTFHDSANLLPSLPLLVIAFGFHNIVPSLNSYFRGNIKKVRTTILGGSAFALVIYILFQIIVLGIIPANDLKTCLQQDLEASQAIASKIHLPQIKLFAQGLGFFALLTSFLAQTMSLVHFLSDALKIPYKDKEDPKMCLLALAPPPYFFSPLPQTLFYSLKFCRGHLCCDPLWVSSCRHDLEKSRQKNPHFL